MKTNEFNKQFSSAKLKENFSKQFNANVNIEHYGREKLEDMRNKLRTRIFQQEGSAGFNDLLTNETYQKNKAMLELLNTRIKEMLGEQMQKLRDKMDALNEAKKGTRPPKTKISAKGSKPDFLDVDKDGDKKEPMKKAVKDKVTKEAAEKTPSTWTDSKGKKHPATKVKGDKYTGKDAEKDVKEDDSDRKPAKQKEREVTLPSGAKVKARTVQGWQSQKADKTADKEKGLDEGKAHAKDCDCKECATMEGKKPDFLDMDKDGNKKETMKKAVADKKKNPFGNKKKVKESRYKHNVRFVNESLAFLINEDEEGKAKAITAAGDMVNDFTSWMQRVGQYQTKTMIELADAIKADFGAAEAEAFKQAVAPSLSATLETLTSQREAISNAVAVLAGEASTEEPMGADPMAAPMEPGMDIAGPDEMNPPAGDEFGASDAAAGGSETAGRAMRESKEQRRSRKLSEAHSIMAKLSK